MVNFGSFFRRKAPNMGAPAQPAYNTANLNTQVRGLVSAIRKLRGTVPSDFQTVNAFVNATKAERATMNRAIVNFINKYNKAVEKTNVAAAVPAPTTVEQATNATRQAVTASQQVQRQVAQANKYTNMSANNLSREAAKNLSPNNRTKLRNAINKKLQTLNKTSRQYENLTNAVAKLPPTRQQGLQGEAAALPVPELSNKNNKRNLLKTLTNANLANNTKVNAAIKKIRGMNPNANWTNVNANGFTNAQKKVLNGLKQGKNYVGLTRQATPGHNVDEGNLSTDVCTGPASGKPRSQAGTDPAPGKLTAPTATQQPSVGQGTSSVQNLYRQYPLLNRVKSTLNSVQNTEESTGKAQYTILQTAQRPGLRGRTGPYMNKFNWSALKNDSRLNPAQKKTVNKILASLQVPVRDKFRNRPPLNFNIKNKKFLKENGSVNIAKLNAEVRNRLPKERVVLPPKNENVFYNAQQQFNNKNQGAQMFRQHREAYGN
jgi:hypothetical protein